MKKRKVIMAIADGIGDRPISSLQNKTPLESANTPHLDFISENGINGIVDLISPGIPVGTDMGHLILFGYEQDDYPERGPIEALGINMSLEPGDIVMRCNFAHIDDKGIVIDRRAGRIRHGTNELAKSINGMKLTGGITAYFKEATEHRAVLVLRGDKLNPSINDTDPLAPNDGKPYYHAKAINESEEAERTAFALNEFLQKAHHILQNHPVNTDRVNHKKLSANFILTRGAGILKHVPSIYEKTGIKGSCIAGEGTVLGVAKLAGYETITDKAMTGNLDTDYKLKAKNALQAIETNDIVYVHMKAPDIQGHDNEPNKKVHAIEQYDQLVGELLSHLPADTYIVLAADHSTPCEVGEHTGEPVPVAIYGPSIRKDRVKEYNEIDCAYGGLGRLNGINFIQVIHDLMGYTKKLGN